MRGFASRFWKYWSAGFAGSFGVVLAGIGVAMILYWAGIIGPDGEEGSALEALAGVALVAAGIAMTVWGDRRRRALRRS